MINYQTKSVDTHKIFYRVAGNADSPAIVLLHGFPTSSHMFRNLIPQLAQRYYVIAPDFPGFGFSDSPDRSQFKYTFANITNIIAGLIEAVGLKKFAVYIFDYGAPIGLRLALAHPDKITAIISQNGNAYDEGLSDAWAPIRKYWQQNNETNRKALCSLLTPEATKWQYTYGTSDEKLIAPETYTLDAMLLERPGNKEIQLDLFLDYSSNVTLYPQFQEYLRKHKPPLLAVWGKNDPFFLATGATAFKRDVPNAKVHFYDTGHFALETHLKEISSTILDFLHGAL
jgi:pimeloyl-ACP methyl ester carboxylesterase